MKKRYYLSAALLLGFGLTACGNPSVPETPSSEGEASSSSLPGSQEVSSSTSWSIEGGGSINDGRKNFGDALTADYSNVTIVYDQVYGDGNFEEVAYEYIVNGITVVDDYTQAEMGYTGWWRYSLYAEYESDSWTYWDASQGYEHSGWVANGYRDADLGMWNAYFCIDHLLEVLTENDVEYILGAYYVKTESMAKVLNHGFEFYGDPMTGGSDLTSIGFLLDEEGRFAKILGSVSEKSDDGVVIEFHNYGKTTSPIEVPEGPNVNNTYTYAEMLGDKYVADVYATAVSLKLEGDKTEAELKLDDSIDVELIYLPDNTNVTDVDWHSTNEEVAVVNYKTNPTKRHKYISGVGVGTAEIYVTYRQKDGTVIESNRIRVTVTGEKEQVREGAVYDLDVLTTTDVVLEGGAYDHTEVGVYNYVHTTATASVTGHNVHALPAANCDDMGDEGNVLSITPSAQEFMNNGFYSELSFDFDDQQVTSMSFHYALQKANQRSDALSHLSEAYAIVSNDGETWSEPIDMKAEMLANFEKINLDYASNQKLMERSFPASSKVKLFFKANIVGAHITLVADDFVFIPDETCHNHGSSNEVAVSSVAITGANRIKVGKTSQFLVSEILPENATDKNVTWHSSDEEVLSVSVTGVVRALKEGNAEIYATASNGVESNHISVTAYVEHAPASLTGRFLKDEVWCNGSYQDVEVTIDGDSASVTVGETSMSFAYDTYNEDFKSIAPHTFKGDAGILRVREMSNGIEILLQGNNGIVIGNPNTNATESLARYVASTGITVKEGSSAVSSKTMLPGETLSLKATVTPTNAYDKTVNAVSDNVNVATVSKSGDTFTVTAVAAGNATITFSNSEGKTATVEITVNPHVAVSSISLSADTSSINTGADATITATPNAGYTQANFVWSVSNSEIATVTPVRNNPLQAKVRGLAAGTVTVTCTDTLTGVSNSMEVTVSAAASIIPGDLVGTYTGLDECSCYETTITLNADGSGSISIESCCDYTLTFVSSSGDNYYFVTDDGLEVVIEVGSSGIYLTIDGGEMNDDYWYQYTGNGLFQK